MNPQQPAPSIHLDFSHVPAYHFEIGPVRPPSEGQDRSLLIRVNRNCPWNRCVFCGIYKGQKFEYRSVDEVKGDIDVARVIAEGLKRASWLMGAGGKIYQEVIRAVTTGTPEAYDPKGVEQEEMISRLGSLSNVVHWLNSGGRTVFLQDANAIIMRPPELVEVVKYLKEAFPSVERVTSYGRARTLCQRSVEELRALCEAGLNRVHIGLESGCDEVLAFMDKGVTGDGQIEAGVKAKAAGISVSQYLMPGLGGRKWSEKHALDSARVVNAVNPDFLRLRSLVVRRGSDLYDKMKEGDFGQLTEEEVIDEIHLLIESLTCTTHLVSDQMSNLLPEIEGHLPEDKEKVLGVIRAYKAMPLADRLAFRLHRRTRSFLATHPDMSDEIANLVEEATQAIRTGTPEAAEKTEQAVIALKQGFI